MSDHHGIHARANGFGEWLQLHRAQPRQVTADSGNTQVRIRVSMPCPGKCFAVVSIPWHERL